MDKSTQLFVYDLTCFGGHLKNIHLRAIQGQIFRVCCYGCSEIIDSHDKIMTKVNVCINAFQQQIDLFDKDNINYNGTKK